MNTAEQRRYRFYVIALAALAACLLALGATAATAGAHHGNNNQGYWHGWTAAFDSGLTTSGRLNSYVSRQANPSAPVTPGLSGAYVMGQGNGLQYGVKDRACSTWFDQEGVGTITQPVRRVQGAGSPICSVPPSYFYRPSGVGKISTVTNWCATYPSGVRRCRIQSSPDV